MHGTTKGEDLFNQVIMAMNNFELPFEKLSGIATDGAPAMVGAQKGLTALVKKEMSRLSLDPRDLVVCHEYGDLVYHCEVRVVQICSRGFIHCRKKSDASWR